MYEQVLGRNLEGVVNSATELKKKWSDQFCSVEHLVQALAADVRFGEALFKHEGLTKAKLEEAIKEVSWGGRGCGRGQGIKGGISVGQDSGSENLGGSRMLGLRSAPKHSECLRHAAQFAQLDCRCEQQKAVAASAGGGHMTARRMQVSCEAAVCVSAVACSAVLCIPVAATRWLHRIQGGSTRPCRSMRGTRSHNPVLCCAVLCHAMQIRGSNKVVDQDPEGKYEALSKYARDLTAAARDGKLDPVIGRDDEIRRCIQILSRRTKNNPVLIGEPGGWQESLWHAGCVRCNQKEKSNQKEKK